MRTNDEIITIIYELKEAQGLSLSELARRVGMAKSALSRYFNKTRQFPINKVDVFANVLDTTSEYILGFEKKLDINQIYPQLSKEQQKAVFNYALSLIDSQSHQ